MERRERWIYRDMLDVYYDKEQPFPGDLSDVCSMVGVRNDEERAIVADLLRSKFVKTDSGYTHTRCDVEILSYRSKADAAKENGKKGGRPNKNNPNKPTGFRSGSDSVSGINQSETGSQANHEPITNNHQPSTNSVPSGTGGKPPPITDPNEIIFGYGVPMLVNAGTPEKQARSFLGGLRKHHGDTALIDKLRECAKAKVLQPLEWLAAALPPGGAAVKLNAQEALEASNRAVVERLLAKEAAYVAE